MFALEFDESKLVKCEVIELEKNQGKALGIKEVGVKNWRPSYCK